MGSRSDGAANGNWQPRAEQVNADDVQRLVAEYRRLSRDVLPLYLSSLDADGVRDLENRVPVKRTDPDFELHASKRMAFVFTEALRAWGPYQFEATELPVVQAFYAIDPATSYDMSLYELIQQRFEARAREIGPLEAQIRQSRTLSAQFIQLWHGEEPPAPVDTRVLN